MGNGLKFDSDKQNLRFLLGPLFRPLIPALEAVHGVLEHGAKKYGAQNWQELEDFEARYTNAELRHIQGKECGESTDPDSRLLHAAHAACNALFLLKKELEDAAPGTILKFPPPPAVPSDERDGRESAFRKYSSAPGPLADDETPTNCPPPPSSRDTIPSRVGGEYTIERYLHERRICCTRFAELETAIADWDVKVRYSDPVEDGFVLRNKGGEILMCSGTVPE